MASYTSEAVLQVLLEMHREFAVESRRGRHYRGGAEPGEVDDEKLAAAVLFVKYLAARAGDVFLIGSAELLGLQAEEIENRRWERSCADLGIEACRPPPPPGSFTYASDDFAAALTVLDSPGNRGRLAGGSVLGGGWIAAAASFVKRLAAGPGDVGLIGRAEVFVLEEERRQRESRERSRQEDEERERQEAEERERKWNEYTWVADSMLGDRLEPKVGGPDVKRLLQMAGVTAKVEKRWVLTEAGVKYANPERAKVGEPPGWAAWSKAVLELLQATLDKHLDQKEGGAGWRVRE